MPISIDCHGDSHVGRHRPANEDQFLIADLNKSMRVHQTSLGLNHQTRLFGGSQGKLLLVADGLGGHESGERASTLAVDGVANYLLNAMDWLFRTGTKTDEEIETELRNAFVHSQNFVDAEATEIPQRRGMATTLTMGYINWPELFVVHVGDTRCYHVRESEIKQLTTDHTLAQLNRDAAIEDGTMKEGDTQPHNPMGHALWNVIGGHNSSLAPQISKETLEIGDKLLLCSDGLTNYVDDDELLDLIKRKETAAATCQTMIDMANERGGRDNITVVLARIQEETDDTTNEALASRQAADRDTLKAE